MKTADRLYTSSAMQSADDFAMESLGIPSEILMENAGIACADAAASITKEGDDVVVLSGVGSNGGDGFVVARHLARMGRRVSVFIAGDEKRLKGASLVNYSILSKLRIPCTKTADIADDELNESVRKASLVVDALLGTGAAGKPRGEILRAISATKGVSPILAIDGPSGVDLNDGTVPGEAIDATVTVTMIAPKIGHFVSPGRIHSGRIVVAHIGVSRETLVEDRQEETMSLIDRAWIESKLPVTPLYAHKGTRGGVLVIAGSLRYPGAAVLASRGVLRGGAGLCVLAAPEIVRPYLSSLPEVIFEPLDSADRMACVLDRWRGRCSAAIIGPGMDRNDLSHEILSVFFKDAPSEYDIVVDGDGLTLMADLDIRPNNIIITPHEGEAARLLGLNSAEISARRLEAVVELGRRYGVCLLKGYGTLLSDGERRSVVLSGNQALSVPGSGDVLSGLTGAMRARGCSPMESVEISAWLHGTSGELLSEKGVDGILASEIADAIPSIMGEFL